MWNVHIFIHFFGGDGHLVSDFNIFFFFLIKACDCVLEGMGCTVCLD